MQKDTKKEVRGLSDKEAKEKLEKYGFNEIKETNLASPIKILLRQIKKNYIIYLLFVAMIISFFVGKSITAYTILTVILIVIFVGFIQEYRAEKVIKSLKEMLVPVSIVIRNGKEKEIPSREIVPGDIIVLRSGEKIPADCLIIEEKDLLVNESILTGESKEISKKSVKDLNDLSKYSDENLLFMGSFIMNGRCLAQVIHTGMNTKFGQIAGMISTAEKELPLQAKTNKISKYLALLGAFFAIIIGIIMIIRVKNYDYNFLIEIFVVVVAVAVASFPEGFPVVLITALSTGAHRMAKKNAIINRMSIIETLGETTVICADKTGTITKGEMTVKKIFSDNKIFEVSGTGYEVSGDFFINKRKIDLKKEPVLNLLLNASVMCNDSRIERTGEDNIYHVIGSGTEAALLIMSAKAGIFKEDLKFTRKEEIPFNSERKIMSVLCRFEGKNFVYSKGAPEILLEKCKYIQRYNGIFTLTERERKRILKINKEMTSNTLRTLAVAYKKVISVNKKEHFEKDLIFLGLVGMEDPAREEVKEAIKTCRKAGICVKMITGDNRETALAIAKEIGLHGEVLEGNELENMTEDELSKIVRDIVIFARVKPEHKLKIVKALKLNGEIVTMTGDGVNDSPALKEAHIGIAMGKGGTDVSRSVADLTLKDNNFNTIVKAIKEGRTIFNNIQKFLAYQISINASQVALIFFAIIIGLPLPLAAIQILFMNLFSDEIMAITLALNPSSPDIMTNKPRKKKSILNRQIITMIIIAGLIMSLGSLGIFYYLRSIGEPENVARTVTLTSMIFFGLANAFNFRSFRKKTLTRSPMTNKLLFYAAVFVIFATLLVIYFKPFNNIFETTPIKFIFLLIPFFGSFFIIILFDILKNINEKKRIIDIENF